METKRGPVIWPLALAAVVVVLLLDNFLLLGDFDATLLWPLLLVLVGAQILLQGDFVPDRNAKTFGITRGSVESATLEVSAGEIDVTMRALQREGRLIAGHFAAQSRPIMRVDNTRAHLIMNRKSTPWLSLADWEMGLARDLPWQIWVSTSLGQVNLDLSALILQDALIATGIGDIRLVCPREALGTLHVRSALGNIQIITAHGCNSRIILEESRLFRARVDETRYIQVEPGVYAAQDAEPDASVVEVVVSGTFGDAYLA
ncbi:MAG: hypothetical protein K8I30_17560 [Anaerolineae bacterium]|nr:hypothetical protein [Anaerolineae bacterium]